MAARFPQVGAKQRAVASTGVVAVAGAGLLAAIITAPGNPVTDMSLNDGSVWVTSQKQGALGRLNRQVDRLDTLLLAESNNFDVVQQGSYVVLNQPTAGKARIVDVSYAQFAAEVKLPEGATVNLGGDTAAIFDGGAGKGWIVPVDQLAGFTFESSPPTIDAGAGAQLTVGQDGSVHVLSVTEDKVITITPGTDPKDTDLGRDVEAGSITAVGEVPVVLTGTEALILDGRVQSVGVAGAGEGARLQQPGPTADEVMIAGASGLVAAPLNGGSASEVVSGGSAGAAAPAVVAGCVHAAWSGTPQYARACDGREPVSADLPDAVAGGELAFRVNRNVVALNDTGAGFAWIMDDLGQTKRVDDWENLKKLQERDDKGTEDDEQQEAVADDTEKCNTPSLPPDAVDDSFGARVGQPAVMPVTMNDQDPDTCDVVVVTAVEQPAGNEGTFEIVGEGTALQFTPASSASGGTVSATYTLTDGRGGSDTATARVVVTANQANGAPLRLRESRTSMESGKQVTYNVITDWTDPEGDPVFLTSATSDQATVRWSSDGTITVVDSAVTSGRVNVAFMLGDGTDAAEGVLGIDVKPAGSPMPPTARGDFAMAVVGKPTTITPLTNDTDANGDALKLVSLTPAADSTVTSDPATGTVVFTPNKPGSYVMPYQVSDGGTSVNGTVRVDARDAGQGKPPVAVLDKATARPGSAPTVVEVLRNDSDPDGDAIAVTGATADPDSGLQVSVVEFSRLRITANTTSTVPQRISYTITDGVNTAEGAVLVTTGARGEDSDQPPIARPDQASVRAGDVVDIKVLDNDSDPEGALLQLQPTLAEKPTGGFMFVDGSRLRYQAQAEPGSVSAVYQVSDQGKNVATARVNVTVLPQNDAANRPPQPVGATARLVAGTTVDIPIALIGIDPDGDSSYLVGADTSPTIGALGAITPGSNVIRFTAPAGVSGLDEFRYRVSDVYGSEAVGVVRVVVIPQKGNKPPVTTDDIVVVKPGRTVSVPVLANDEDADGDALTVAPATEAQPPGVTFGNQSITVDVPNQDGTTQNVPYVADDGRGGRTPGLLSISASTLAPALPPVAVDDFPTDVAADATSVTVNVLANDRDPDGTREALTVALMNPAQGAVSGADVSIEMADRPQRVAYSATDPDGNVAYAFISVPGRGLGRVPALKPGTVLEVKIGETVTAKLADVVADPLSRPIKLTDKITVPTNAGKAAAVDAQTFSYTPSDTAPSATKVGITVQVEGVNNPTMIDVPVRVLGQTNRAPVATVAAVEVPRGDGEVRLPLGAYVTDPDPGDTVTFRGAKAEGSGLDLVEINGSDLVLRAPGESQPGTVRVVYEADDGKNPAVPATVDVRIVDTKRQAPRAVEDTIPDATAGQSIRVAVLDNDFNPFADQGKPLRVVGAQVPDASGSASFDDSSVTFTAATGFFGTARVVYRIEDAAGRATEGQVSVSVTGPPEAPGAPRVDRMASGTVALTWSAPANNNGSPITGYRVESDGAGGQECPSTSCQISGLTNGSQYRFRVIATNAKGDSPASSWSEAVTPDEIPGAPGAPIATVGSGTLSVSWAPPSNNGSPIDAYQLDVNGQVRDMSGGTTSTQLTGLENGTLYTFRVRAHNKAGWGDWGGAGSETPATTPGAPTMSTPAVLESDTGNKVSFSWSAGDTGGSPITGQVLTPIRNGASLGPVQLGAGESSYAMAAEDGARYSFSISVSNKLGSSQAATSGESPLVYSKPGAPTGVTATATRGVVTLSFNPPANNGGQPILRYLVQPSVGEAFEMTETSGTWRNPVNGQRVTFDVSASNGKTGDTSTSNEVTPYGSVSVDGVELSVDGTSLEGFYVNWGSVESTSGLPITVSVRLDDGTPISSSAAGGRQQVLKACDSGQSYTVILTARDGGGSPGDVDEKSTTVRCLNPKVNIAKGEAWNDHPNCTRGNCTSITVILTGFAPNSPVTVDPWGSWNGFSAYGQPKPFTTDSAGNLTISKPNSWIWGYPSTPGFDAYVEDVTVNGKVYETDRLQF